MKNSSLLMTTGFLAAALLIPAFSQTSNQQQPQAQAMGRGRGGAPYAWGDKDKDGKCDVTGRPVGQGRGQMAGRQGMRGGRGMRGGGCCGRMAAQAQPAPEPKK